jgi:thioester reductase-like protein
LSVFDLFGAFAAGATLVIPHAPEAIDAFAWVHDVRRHAVTVWNSVPSALDMLLEAAGDGGLPSLRHLLVSGDWIPLSLPPQARRACPEAKFIALGGATEASIWSNFQRVDSVEAGWASIPYGWPLGGQSMFVADAHDWPQPVGVPGEICIGGGGLAMGYWRDPERTRRRFPLHPVSGQRIYRTGDLGRTFANGAIEFLGRLDGQVKVRGVRVDLRQVEAALVSHPMVSAAIVAPRVATQGLGVESLAAFVVATEGGTLDLDDLRRHATQQLPAAMRPSAYLKLPALPLNANGKVDRAALPDLRIESAAGTERGAAPATPAEHRLAEIWQELMPGMRFGRDENFFAAGGHSLLAVRMLARVKRDWGREVPLAGWLEQPTIAHLAQLLADGRAGSSIVTRDIAQLRAHVELDQEIVYATPRTESGAWVVTGATGLIGVRLVAALLARSDADVICILRDRQGETRWREAVALCLGLDPADTAGRLRVVAGDLASPHFGLEPHAFTALAERASHVFHLGAKVNLVAPFDQLAAVNVRGTQEAIRLAALAGGVLCHVSSIGVVPYDATQLVLEDAPLASQGRLLTGYCQTKWVAEQLVRTAMQRGLRAVVVRPGLTVGDGVLPAERDLLASVLTLSRQAGCLPASDMPVDLVDAAFAAAAIAHIGRDPRAQGRTFHLTHPDPRPLADLASRAEVAWPVLPFAQWQERIAELAPTLQDDSLAAIAGLIAGHREDEVTPATVDCRNSNAMLEGSGIHCVSVADLLSQAFGVTE